MKAIRLYNRGGPEMMQLEEIEQPQPREGQVLIRVAVAGINYSDIGQRNGNYPNLRELPITMGEEVAGTVVALGPQVTQLAEGMRVVSLVDGGYAEYAVADASMAVPIPEGVSFEQAIVIPIQGQTAYLLLNKAARMQRGERVLIHAASGGVGTLAVQVARHMGASMIIGTANTPEKLTLIRELGCEVAIDTSNPQWMEQVMQATRGQGVDIVLEAVGGDIGQKSIFCLAPFGRLVAFGSLSGDVTPLVAQMLIPKCQSVTGYNTLVQPLEDKLRASQAMLQLIAADKVRIVIEHTFPLAQAKAAHTLIEEGKTRGKVVLTV